jgi:hypothetical protein
MVEVELSPAGKNSTSVEVLVTTAVNCVSSARTREKIGYTYELEHETRRPSQP